MKDSTILFNNTDEKLKMAINRALDWNSRLDKNKNQALIEEIRSDLFEAFSGEIFAEEHKEAYKKFTGSTQHWDVFKNQSDRDNYADFVGNLVSSYPQKKLFSKALSNDFSQIKNPVLQSAIEKISIEINESFIWNMNEHKFIEDSELKKYKAIFNNLEIDDDIWNEFYQKGNNDSYMKFAKILTDKVSSKLLAEYNDIYPALNLLNFPDSLTALTYEYCSGDVLSELNLVLLGDSE